MLAGGFAGCACDALADMTFNEAEQLYTYLCPCGDLFEITLEELYDGEDIAPCPSCSLKIRVLFEEAQLPPMLTGADPADKTGRVSLRV